MDLIAMLDRDETAPLILSPLGKATRDGWTGLSWQLAGNETPFTLEHAIPEAHADSLIEETRGDHALLVTLLHAMRLGRNIRVEGAVCPDLLTGVETLQDIWIRWRPDRYRRIAVQVEREAPLEAPQDRGALFAFSGGVDGTYTFFRHLTGAAGRRTRRPSAALLVHGMDIPLDQPEMFDGARMRAERMLEGTGVPMLPLRTNSRRLGVDWEDSFGLQLIAAMLTVQMKYQSGVHGSGEPWETLIFPWGSTPFTDVLCNTRTFDNLHDGCEAHRTEKVDWLARNTTVTDDLRVCWQGAQKDRNCGVCEKCLRTKLNFWAGGHPVPAGLPGGLDPAAVSKLKVRNSIQLQELRSLRNFAAARHPASDPLMRALQRQVFRQGLSVSGRDALRKMRKGVRGH